MTDVDKMDVRDRAGALLAPLDLVRIESIPSYNYEEYIGLEPPEGNIPDYIKGFEGSYGLVWYFCNERYFDGNPNKSGWWRRHQGVPIDVYVLTARVAQPDWVGKPCIAHLAFWIPHRDLVKLPFNAFVMSVLARDPGTIEDFTTCPTDQPYLVAGMEKFDVFQRILTTPYDVLCKMHDAAEQCWTDVDR